MAPGAVARVDDDPGRAAILLSVKRDLYLPVLEGVVSMLKCVLSRLRRSTRDRVLPPAPSPSLSLVQ